MAQQGKRLNSSQQQRIAKAAQFMSVRTAARELGYDTKTIQKYKQKKS